MCSVAWPRETWAWSEGRAVVYQLPEAPPPLLDPPLLLDELLLLEEDELEELELLQPLSESSSLLSPVLLAGKKANSIEMPKAIATGIHSPGFSQAT